MKITDYIVNLLYKHDIDRVFGLPGGALIDFLDALRRQDFIVQPQITFSEFSSAYASVGYSQYDYNFGCVFATKGPGMTNIVTPVADSFYDSIPMVVITGSEFSELRSKARVDLDQNINIDSIFGSITKGIFHIVDINRAVAQVNEAFILAKSGRPGPVIIDLNAVILGEEITQLNNSIVYSQKNNYSIFNFQDRDKRILEARIAKSLRPLILVGNGIRISKIDNLITDCLNEMNIPVVSSRTSQDIASKLINYLGYIGSRGVRLANHALYYSDLVIVIGNRFSYPNNSSTYDKLLNSSKFIWFEIDSNELDREINNNVVKFQTSLIEVHKFLIDIYPRDIWRKWVLLNNNANEILKKYDNEFPVKAIKRILDSVTNEYTIISDVGNNELWLSQAYYKSKCNSRLLHSKSLSVMGSAISKAIGTYYKTNKKVLVVIGDQGLYSSLNELVFIAETKLPIKILVINNESSGMIRDRQIIRGYRTTLLTDKENGYITLNLEVFSKNIGLCYYRYNDRYPNKDFLIDDYPSVIELIVNNDATLFPSLPLGNSILNQYPLINNKDAEKLNDLFNTI